MLSQHTITELRAELDRLRGMREQIDRKIECIAGILAPYRPSPKPEHSAEIVGEVSARPNPHAPANGTFRAQVLDALKAIGGRATALEVSEAMARAGVASSGKTPLKTLVSSELWRLARQNPHVKNAGYGRYAFLEGPSPGVGG